MPSDVLQALLGILAGGAKGYVGAKEKVREEEAAAKENEQERNLKRELLGTEVQARWKLAERQMLNERELQDIRIRADMERWKEELKQKREEAKGASEDRRAALAHEMTALQENIRLGYEQLKANVKLETEKIAIDKARAGIPGKYTASAGGNKNLENYQDFLSKTVNTLISASAATGKIPTSAEINTMLNNVSDTDLIRSAYGLPPRVKSPEPPPSPPFDINNMPLDLPAGMNPLGNAPANPMLQGILATYKKDFIGPPVPGPQYMLPGMYPSRYGDEEVNTGNLMRGISPIPSHTSSPWPRITGSDLISPLIQLLAIKRISAREKSTPTDSVTPLFLEEAPMRKAPWLKKYREKKNLSATRTLK